MSFYIFETHDKKLIFGFDPEKRDLYIKYANIYLSEFGLRVFSKQQSFSWDKATIESITEAKRSDVLGKFNELSIVMRCDDFKYAFNIALYRTEHCIKFSLSIPDDLAFPSSAFNMPHLIFPSFKDKQANYHIFSYLFRLWNMPVFFKVPEEKVSHYSSMLALKKVHGPSFVFSPLSNFFTTYVFVKGRSEIKIAGALSGDVRKVPTNIKLEYLFVFADSLRSAILRWGSILRRVYKKSPISWSHPLISKLGYWTDNGAYYYYRREPGMNYHETLVALVEYLRKNGINIGYLEIDSYFYKKGLDKGVLTWRPISKDFPKGLDGLSKEIKLPLVLHNRYFSAFSPYRKKVRFIKSRKYFFIPIAGFPLEPEKIYEEWAEMAKEWNCMAYEQDWLDTQFVRTDELRSDFTLCSRWVKSFAESFKKRGIPIIFCMPNPAFYLESLKHQNVVAIRTSNDYICRKPQTLKVAIVFPFLQKFGYGAGRGQLWVQNIYSSLLAWALGLYPHFDVFITNKNHPEGFDEKFADLEALMRIMSAGIVGFGDKIGYVDKEILSRIALLYDGTLIRPDVPALPIEKSLLHDPLRLPLPIITLTRTTIKDLTWYYMLILNPGKDTIEYNVSKKDLGLSSEYMLYDWFERRFYEFDIEGKLPPKHFRYFVVAPLIRDATIIPSAIHYISASRVLLSDVLLKEGTIIINYKGLPNIRTKAIIYSRRAAKVKVAKTVQKVPPETPTELDFVLTREGTRLEIT